MEDSHSDVIASLRGNPVTLKADIKLYLEFIPFNGLPSLFRAKRMNPLNTRNNTFNLSQAYLRDCHASTAMTQK